WKQKAVWNDGLSRKTSVGGAYSAQHDDFSKDFPAPWQRERARLSTGTPFTGKLAPASRPGVMLLGAA
ncbi:hypothetical protein, partial [Pandoraea pneumonica]|uniref:hypothetical protein n=1 Tax=Pandoraea pneumonica TaxID=2508299 RepID=UPI003CF71BD4